MDTKEQEINSNQPKPKKLKDKLFSFNKTPLLIAGLVILTGILLVVSLNSRSKPASPKLEALQEDVAHTSLSISDEIRTSTVSGVFEVDVIINTDDNMVTGTQLELIFDPEALENVDIVNGTFFENPNILIKEVDSETGQITFVIGKKFDQESVTGEGIVAVISFEKVSDEPTDINFLPQTLVSDEKYNQSVLKETISAVIDELPE